MPRLPRPQSLNRGWLTPWGRRSRGPAHPAIAGLPPAPHSPRPLLLQDLLMVTYLANLTQSQIALNEKLVNL